MTSAYKSPRIAVIGASSMVGSRFCELWQDGENLIRADLNGSPEIDITNNPSVQKFFLENDFGTCILFSAYTDVDGAEQQRDDKDAVCWKINVEGASNIARISKEHSRKLVFISTDFVFDGKNGPYSEEDVCKISDDVSWYGITKIQGENIVKQLKDYLIIRISYPYRSQFEAKDDLFRRTLKSYKNKQLYPMFDDQYMTPTFIDDLSYAIQFLLDSSQIGTFHVASPKLVTPYHLARRLVKTFGGNPNDVKKGSISEFLKSGDKTPRPVKGGLKVDKISQLGFTPTSWDEGIRKMHEQTGGLIT